MLTAYPRPPAPLVVVAASALLVLGAVLAGALSLPEPPTFASASLIAGVLPWRRAEALRRMGLALCFFVGAWALFGLTPMLTIGEHLPGPYGGHTLTFAFVLVAATVKIWALSTEAARHWCSARWVVGTSGDPAELSLALARALKSDTVERDAAVDAAVVTLAETRGSGVPRDESQRRGLFIDVYNVLAQHARRGRRSQRVWDVVESYRVRYELFGATLSNDQIEHAILRGNRAHPRGLSWPFSSGDSRKSWVVALDPRVHFALNCGLRSCPLIRTYFSADIDARLDAAASFFVCDTTQVDDATRTLTLSQLFEFYADDFGGPIGIRRFVARYLERAPDALDDYTLTFTPYDFTPAFVFADE